MVARYGVLIEKPHLKFCKHMLNLKSSTPNFMVYGELGKVSFNNHCLSLNNKLTYLLHD